MKAFVLLVTLLSVCPCVLAQSSDAQTTQPPSYANYSLMLVSPVVGGGAVALMHNPKNELEFVDVSKTKEAFAAGYVPVRAAELSEFIVTLKEENARLADENRQLRIEAAKQVPTTVVASPQAQIEAQQRAQVEAEKAARRQAVIQAWLGLQMNRPKPSVLPMPNANRLQTHCVTTTTFGTTTTNCN